MTRLITCGWESGGPVEEKYVSLVNTPDISATEKRSGNYALFCDTTSQTAEYVEHTHTNFAAINSETLFVRFWFRFSGAPAFNTRVLAVRWASTTVQSVFLGTDRTMYLTNFTGNRSAVLAANTWHLVEFRARPLTGADEWELRVNGTVVVNSTAASGEGSLNFITIGLNAAPDTPGISAYFDDFAVNNSAGASENSWPDPDGKIIALKPISDNARVMWTGGAGGTTNLYDAVNNTPPIGHSTETNLTQIEHPGGSATSNDDYDANMESYTTGGIGASDTIKLVVPVCIHGEDVSTGTKILATQVVSNPAGTLNNQFNAGDDAGALGIYPSFWKPGSEDAVYAPTPTLGTSPVMRVRRLLATGTRVASVCGMFLMVEYVPAPVGGESKSSADTATLSSDEVESLAVALTDPDTATLSSAQADSVSIGIPSSDSGTISSDEVESLQAGLTSGDSGSLSSAEGHQITVPKENADTATLSSAQVDSLAVAETSSDSGSLSSSEAHSVGISIPSGDSGSLSSAQANAVEAGLSSGDTGVLSAAESHSRGVGAASADTGAISSAQVDSVSAQESSSDSGTISSAQANSLAAGLSSSDAGTLSSSQAASLAAALSPGDVGVLISSESHLLVVQVSSSDAGAITSGEASDKFIPGAPENEPNVPQVGVISSSESHSVNQEFIVAQVGTLSSVQASSMTAAVLSGDSAVLSSGDLSNLLAEVLASDLAVLSSLEGLDLGVSVISGDVALLSSTFGSIVGVQRFHDDVGILSSAEEWALIANVVPFDPDRVIRFTFHRYDGVRFILQDNRFRFTLQDNRIRFRLREE
jgi:hypothetical protein